MPAAKSHKKMMYYIQAEHIANALIARLKPLCEPGKCVVAGSLRRGCERLNDIEILCIPKVGKAQYPGEMFPVNCNLVIHHLSTSSDIKTIKGGPRYQQVVFSHVQCDIFMTNASQWGRMLAIRTGPAEYSVKLASRWKELGYKGVNGQLIMETDSGSSHRPAFPTERSFFEFLSWDYVKPENRQ